ncbi:ornithine carbamoyltransferase [Candidatus Uhrbacteria bacterium]|nr:ornithine carbamoyltransferase [Candidatus Uhrbacteria bacterium]
MKDNLLAISDLTKKQIEDILALGVSLHRSPVRLLTGKSVLCSFEKPSLRTVVTAQVAIHHLGGDIIHVRPENFFGGKILFSSAGDSKLEGREALKDTVKNVSQWCDAIFARVYSHETLLEIASQSDIPVINALSDRHHPLQALADLLTIRETFGSSPCAVAFVGDANNVAFSLIEVLLLFGYDMRFASPAAYSFSPEQQTHFQRLASRHAGAIMITHDPLAAVRGADVIYTDTFVSMGEEDSYDKKIASFEGYQVNKNLMAATEKKSYFMHCLPAHRGVEVTDEIIDSSCSLVYRQAKNRLITAKGVFAKLLNPV